MISRFYIHNYRGLDNFELSIQGKSSVLLIGKNGSGKTTVSEALLVLQKIAKGSLHINDLVTAKDFTRGRVDTPMRFELEIELSGNKHEYSIAFELPTGEKNLRILDERLTQGGQNVFTRKHSQINFNSELGLGSFPLSAQMVGLSVVQNDSLQTFTRWLSQMLILRPLPALITGEAAEQALLPHKHVTNFGAWFSALTQQYPASYVKIHEYLKAVLPDLKEIQNLVIGNNTRNLVVQFSNGNGTISLDFGELSDGEKCFMICGLVLAANHSYGPLLCFWDEPDNYLALDEVGHFVMALRRAFLADGGQFIATSHNPEAIRCFSDENTLVMHRRNHLEPTIIRPLSEIQVNGDLINALIRGDVEP